MKILFFALGILLFSLHIHAQETINSSSIIEKGFSSKILGQERKVWIHVPKTDRGAGPFPVLYLLDGEVNFQDVVTITEFMSNSGLCPAMIVVGILHPSRMTDLTLGRDKNTPGVVGNGESFIRYVQKELMPYVESNYPTAPYKLFLGHSVGGLTVVNTLLYQPNLFNAYISLDGALWWNDQQTVKQAKRILPNTDYTGKTLFIALANRMEKGMDTLSVQKDTSEGTELIRSNLEFIKDIAKNQTNRLRFGYKYYENDDHGSVRLIGEYDALRYIFDYYKLKIYNSALEDAHFRLDSLLITHYTNVSAKIGYRVTPNEGQVNGLAYYMMRQRQFVKAEALFKLNIANYPQSANCYDGLGDLYSALGEKEKAVESFRKTLRLKPIPETKEKLEKLLKEDK